MSREPVIQGWCPGALRPMMSGDGLVVRIRVPGGRLTPDQARGIALLSRAHGNGQIDLSARANVQLRGVIPKQHAPLIDGLRGLGLIDATPADEARRNILVTPFWSNDDPAPVVAADLAHALASRGAPDLPAKFGFAVDCGPRPVLRDSSADIRIECGANGKILLRADGANTGAQADLAELPTLALILANWFIASGGVKGGRGRMHALLQAGVPLPQRFREARATTLLTALPPMPGPVRQGYVVAFAFGQIEAETLAALADLGALRMTPWRMILIEGGARAPVLPGVITTANDPLLRVVACTGAPGCPQALGPTRSLARALSAHVPDGTVLHVAGCAKGCAHPGPADHTLVATAQGYQSLPGQSASAPATDPPLSGAACLADPDALFRSNAPETP